MVEELAVFGGPANLHDTVGDDEHLIVPDTTVRVVRTAHTLKRKCVTSRLHTDNNMISTL